MSTTQAELIRKRREARAVEAAKKAAAAKPTESPVDDADDTDSAKEAPKRIQSLSRAREGATGAIANRPQVDLTRQIDATDMVMPKLKLSQAMSKVNSEDIVRQGNWYHSVSNRNFGKTVYFVPVDMRKSRSYFVQGQGVLCRSFDLLKGEGDPGMLCEGEEVERYDGTPASERGCPLRLWERDPDKGINRPPACGITYNYPGLIVLDPDDPDSKTMRVLLQLRSTATKTAKTINTLMTEGDLGWGELILELGVQQTSNTKGTFFSPTAEAHAETEGTVRKKAMLMAQSINPDMIRRSIENDDTD